ncbi:hypothetical protein [Winogradskyella forsetii]|uniref:hypothetical protein n=1 Tax=Winogradskyella forsetii TaxID=2686077 RepID=UPI0015BDB3DE|nr:hypothetical protein [Winogradskyella forsetii]
MADLSIAKECDIQLITEQVWADSQNQTDQYTADAETIRMMADKQADRNQILTSLEDTSLEDDEIKVIWIDQCGEELDETCQEVCDFTASDVPLASETYSLTDCVSKSFAADENDFLRNKYTIEEYIAKQLLHTIKLLDEQLNAKALLFLSANAGLNTHPEAYTFNATTLEVDAADYTNEMYVKMAIDAKMNKIMDPFVVDNGALYRAYLRAQLDKDNYDGSGNQKRTMLFDTSFDLLGFPKTAVTDTTFLVSPYSYAFGSRNYNSAAPTIVETKDLRQIRYSIPSNNVPGVVYDVTKQIVCSGNRFKHEYLVKARTGFFLNPVGCDVLVDTEPDVFDNVTGILSYTKN